MRARPKDSSQHPLVLPEPNAARETLELDGDERRKRRLVMEMGRALHRFGAPAHRLEDALRRVSRLLGLEAKFFAVPTALFAFFGPLGSQKSGFVRIDDEDVHLGKIAEIDQVLARLFRGELNPEGALERIREISKEPSRYGAAVSLAAFALSSAAGAVFFGGGWMELVVAAFLGLLVGLLARHVGRRASRHIFVPLAASLCAVVASGLNWLLGPYSTQVATLAGIIYLLPGLTLTVALTELSTRNLVAGTARLTVAVLTLLGLGFGVALGTWFESFSPHSSAFTPEPLPLLVDLAAVVLAPLAFAVLFHARRRDIGWILLACILAFGASRAGSWAGGAYLGAAVGALSAGLYANIWGRSLGRPPIIVSVPAIILLVPGSMGFRSVAWMLADDTISGIDAAFETGFVGMALSVGLLMANVLVPPPRTV